MKFSHTWTLVSFAAMILMGVLIAAIGHNVTQTPHRTAVAEIDGKLERVDVRSYGSFSDQKLLNWLEYVIPTCFSLTVTNIDTKSEKCEQDYFNRTAGAAYQWNYVNDVREKLTQNDGSLYLGLPYTPLITSSPDPQRNKLYYVVYMQTISSLVGRSDTAPDAAAFTVWVAPKINAKNAHQYTIIGISM